MRKNVIHLITNKVDLLIDRVFDGAWIFLVDFMLRECKRRSFEEKNRKLNEKLLFQPDVGRSFDLGRRKSGSEARIFMILEA